MERNLQIAVPGNYKQTIPPHKEKVLERVVLLLTFVSQKGIFTTLALRSLRFFFANFARNTLHINIIFLLSVAEGQSEQLLSKK